MDAPRYVLSPPPIEAPNALPTAQMDELRRMAQEFESMVLRELLGPMFEPLDTEGVGGGGSGERMFRPMLVGEYAEGMAARGGVGLADLVLAEMVRLQVAQTPPTEG